MICGISYNGGMIYVDSQGQKHIFCTDEVEFLSTAIYKFRQAKYKGKGVIHRDSRGLIA